MQSEIITIGDEILIGQIIDSNSAYISKELNKIGVAVYQITSVQDDANHILEALAKANERSDLVIITGGLGPTKDDITKHTLCDFMDDTLEMNSQVLSHIEALFKKYISTPISDLNRKQALVPTKATVLQNNNGTAPGLWMTKNKTVFISLPGVPFEMKNLIQQQVIPRVVTAFKRPHIVHRTLITYGLGESAIAERIEAWENALPPHIKLAYLPNLGRVRLRISARGHNKDEVAHSVNDVLENLYPLISDILHGFEDNESLEAIIGKELTQKGLTLATAESFTGGRIAQQLTAQPGASNYFKGSIVSYATQTKIEVLGVPNELIEQHSVVSSQVAQAMAERVKVLLGTDFSIATTGNAGPTKGDSESPIGTVYIAIGTPKQTIVEHFVMGNHRERVVQKSVNKALELLRKEILNF